VNQVLVFLSLNLYLGNIYISDTSNNRIRKVTVVTGIITTFAGTGTGGYGGDWGSATSALLKQPCGLALDSLGIFIIIMTFFPSLKVLLF
jgi:hypothetical protein